MTPPPVVDARALHAAGQVRSAFRPWLLHALEACRLTERRDYVLWLRRRPNARPHHDYHLTVPAAYAIAAHQRDPGARDRMQTYLGSTHP